jgi:hypothetical protein
MKSNVETTEFDSVDAYKRLYRSVALRAIFAGTIAVGTILSAAYFEISSSFGYGISALGLSSIHPALAIGILTAASALIFSLVTAAIYHAFTTPENESLSFNAQKLK